MNASPVKIIDNFLSEDNCNELITKYTDKAVRSKVIDSNHTTSYIHQSRTSSTYFIPNTDTIIIELKKKVALFLDISENQIETIQFLRYRHGEKYSYHHDYLSGNPQNQRVHTIILYLNSLNDEDGGKTSFVYHNLKVKPETGRGVWFRNIDDKNNLIKESLHSGEEILRENMEKYALNIWTRQYPV